ncbi:hypothetical protein JIN85_09605 [Luteolibacter pohnpeiensis]|uniref:RcnB family protein n=1 Tax=Luteolibacter pohnpeiensis TaxID=454153 RepID=A0A934SAK0_9BACT|nr:hypothetical protein [Luteolibacter pohnpeiensis]MBK1882672.1 hypothetical protein [Luteolibacter pohnpeiensis]
MKARLTKTLTVSAMLLSLSLASQAKPDSGKGNKGKGKSAPSSHAVKHDNGSSKSSKGNDSHDRKIVTPSKKQDDHRDDHKFTKFRDSDRTTIVQYFSKYRDNDHGLPPGLAKNLHRGKSLPPGWQDKVAPGYRIQDDWWPLFTLVPSDWFPGLQLETGIRLYQYNDRLVRVYEPTHEVIDVVIIPTIRF